MILKYECKIDLSDYTYEEKNGIRRWDKSKLKGTKLDIMLNAEYTDKKTGKGIFRYGEINSDSLAALITRSVPEQTELVQLINDLRSAEKNIRNKAAHQIVSVTDADIKREAKFSSFQVIDMIIQAFHYTDINIRENDWNAYDTMNEEIIKRIGISGN